MNERTTRRLVWLRLAFTLIITAIGAAILLLTRDVDVGPRWGPRPFPIIFALGFGNMGTLISLRRPENRIGWLFGWVSMASGFQLLVENYAVLAVLARPGELPLGAFVAWVQSWIWIPAAVPAITFLPLLYPDGQLPSPRWRPLVWVQVVGMLLLGITTAFKPGPLNNFPRLENPYPLWSTPLGNDSIAFLVIQLFMLPCVFGAAVSLFVRMNRETGVKRQQIKWFAYAGSFLFVGAVGGFLGPISPDPLRSVGPLMLIGALMLLPVVTGIAILRYRLYDIDIIIQRTLVYSILTGLLALAYFGLVLIFQYLFTGLLGRQSPIVTVVSTLAVAALFFPLRARVQDFVDRRFYRRKYDAAKTLAAFAETARDEVELEKLTERLVQVVDETMQPESASLWLKNEERPK